MGSRRTAGRVIVGVDHTASGLQALRRGLAEARLRGGDLHAVRAWSFERELEEEAEGLIGAAFNDSLGGVPAEVWVRPVTIADVPGRALVGYANREDDLLVVGAGQGSRWRRQSRGRVVRYCLSHASCAVLVVPPPPLTRGRSTHDLLRELRHDLDRGGVWGPHPPGATPGWGGGGGTPPRWLQYDVRTDAALGQRWVTARGWRDQRRRIATDP